MRRLLLTVMLCRIGNAEIPASKVRWHISVHLVNAANVPAAVVERAKMEVSKIYTGIGVQLQWTNDRPDAVVNACDLAPAQSFSVKIVPIVTAGASPSATASANSRTGTIIVYYDRVREVMVPTPSRIPMFLAYVLAHEIGHISQVAGLHAQAGIMKARWTGRDYSEMALGLLQFTPSDIQMIRAGLAFRSCPTPANAVGRMKATEPLMYNR